MRALITCLVLANGLLQSAAIAGDLRIGIVGVDTSHAIAFTKIFQQSHGDGPLRGMKVVAAYPHGSWDIPSSASRIPKNTKRIADLGVKIVGSVDELVEAVDAILLETNDGRPHLEQLLPIFRARKPVFVDKPIAARLSDVLAIYELAEQTQTPLFTSSALRFTPKTQEIRNGSLGTVQKADVFSPATLEPTHSDLFWYGIHGVEPLFTVMGTGCERVRNTSTPDQDVVVGEWKGNRTGTFRGRRKGGGYGGTVFGSKSSSPTGGYVGYAPLVEAIAKFFRTRTPPVPAAESIEIYAFMTAAEESRRRSGASVTLKEVLDKARGKYLTADGAVFDTGFSSAGARFLSVKGNTVRLAPDLRDTEGWWFWWNFRVRGAAGKTFRFEF
ncbi:MAG: Gfo/Idh/MocA family oxidoreductase, partial [Planctomycetota bacterium]